MADQYVGEIRYFPYLRGAPEGWIVCDGSEQQIASYEALAALLGQTYGGDGSSTFGLPDLRGRVPVGAAPNLPLGSTTGVETVALNGQQLPVHNHFIEASTAAGTMTSPAGMVYAAGPGSGDAFYDVPTSPGTTAMAEAMVGPAGQGLPHENCGPTLPILPCIAWDGVWPVKP